MRPANYLLFNPIIPYIKEMDFETQFVVIKIPSNLILDLDKLHDCFKSDLKIEAVTVTLRDGFKIVVSKVLSGTIIDIHLFNYLRRFNLLYDDSAWKAFLHQLKLFKLNKI